MNDEEQERQEEVVSEGDEDVEVRTDVATG